MGTKENRIVDDKYIQIKNSFISFFTIIFPIDIATFLFSSSVDSGLYIFCNFFSTSIKTKLFPVKDIGP